MYLLKTSSPVYPRGWGVLKQKGGSFKKVRHECSGWNQVGGGEAGRHESRVEQGVDGYQNSKSKWTVNVSTGWSGKSGNWSKVTWMLVELPVLLTADCSSVEVISMKCIPVRNLIRSLSNQTMYNAVKSYLPASSFGKAEFNFRCQKQSLGPP